MGNTLKLPSSTKFARLLGHFPPASQAGRLAGPVFYSMYISLLRLYWFWPPLGVTVLLPGKVIWKYVGFPCKMSPSGSESVTALSCCRIWTVWMIIVPNLRWRTFRYWAVRAADVRDIGSSPEGEHWVIPLLTLPWKSQVTTLQTSYNPTSSRFQSTSSMQPQCNVSPHVCIIYQKKQ